MQGDQQARGGVVRLEYVKGRPNRHNHALVALTGAFMLRLARVLEPAELELSVLKQHTAPCGVSMLHEYCDANQVMLDALEAVFPDESQDDDFDLNDEFIAWLVRNAWTHTELGLTAVYASEVPHVV